MKRKLLFRLVAPGAVLLALSAIAVDHLPTAIGGHGAGYARAASKPAWGDPRWTMRYAHDGKCDDPRYKASTGLADPGGDEQDCRRVGGGLK